MATEFGILATVQYVVGDDTEANDFAEKCAKQRASDRVDAKIAAEKDEKRKKEAEEQAAARDRAVSSRGGLAESESSEFEESSSSDDERHHRIYSKAVRRMFVTST